MPALRMLAHAPICCQVLRLPELAGGSLSERAWACFSEEDEAHDTCTDGTVISELKRQILRDYIYIYKYVEPPLAYGFVPLL